MVFFVIDWLILLLLSWWKLLLHIRVCMCTCVHVLVCVHACPPCDELVVCPGCIFSLPVTSGIHSKNQWLFSNSISQKYVCASMCGACLCMWSYESTQFHWLFITNHSLWNRCVLTQAVYQSQSDIAHSRTLSHTPFYFCLCEDFHHIMYYPSLNSNHPN